MMSRQHGNHVRGSLVQYARGLREPGPWRGGSGAGDHSSLFVKKESDRQRNRRLNAIEVARAQAAKKRREADAERWIAELRARRLAAPAKGLRR